MRRKDLDWLRIFGIFLLFPFHAARVFDSREFNYIQSDTSSSACVVFMNVIWPWFMPLLFLIAGMATWYALQKKDAAHYVKERVFRLLIPLVLGIILIVPIQGYMARLQQGTLNGGYFNYLFTQFFPDFSDISGYRGTFTPAHLWFILYLFIISCALLPLLIHIIHAKQKNGTGYIGQLFGKGWFLIYLFLPLTLAEGLPSFGGKNLFFYGLYFTIGFFIESNEKSMKTIVNIRWWSTGIMALTIPVYLYLLDFAKGYHDYAWQSILLAFARNLYGISALMAMLAFAFKYLNRGGRVLDYLNQAAFPIYILHQSIMMVIAYFVLQWSIDLALQFILIVMLTLIASIALFEVSRHFALLRILLGIKMIKKESNVSAK
jgi:glucan biosynthesis protein C